MVLTELGRIDEAIATTDEAVTIAEAHGTADDITLVYANATATYLFASRYGDVPRLAMVGLDHARKFGTLGSNGATMAGNAAEALLMLGRWDEALAMAANHRSDSLDGMDNAMVAALIALWRGHVDDAVDHAARLVAVAGTDEPPQQS